MVLSGCGVRDGSEIHESVITLLALDKAGVEIICAAPDIETTLCIDHYTGNMVRQRRNVLTESARIARGDIVPLQDVHADMIDAVILPGGFGAASNLCNFASEGGEKMKVIPVLERFLLDVHKQRKPLGFICIAPVIAAHLFAKEGVQYTVGNDENISSQFTEQGAVHVVTMATDVVIDEKLKVVTTPAYMLAQGISEAALGINKLVNAVLKLA